MRILSSKDQLFNKFVSFFIADSTSKSMDSLEYVEYFYNEFNVVIELEKYNRVSHIIFYKEEMISFLLLKMNEVESIES